MDIQWISNDISNGYLVFIWISRVYVVVEPTPLKKNRTYWHFLEKPRAIAPS